MTNLGLNVSAITEHSCNLFSITSATFNSPPKSPIYNPKPPVFPNISH